ncbi:SAM-dependent methyltransferase [Thiomonas sp.]|uniref:class I SAM-dependent methyltransferase n=1 Tax=Thiomonas sp. TaxID=2047785 RepID=UPI00258E150B|nr:SAM-dependent methyltransferase [Thiomonas sp.]
MNEQSASLPAPAPMALERSAQLLAQIRAALHAGGGWLPFDAYMQQALYAPGLGYYTGQAGQFGDFGSDSDFVTAPELSPLFGRTLAAQVAKVLQQGDLHTVVEFGAGSGRLAAQILGELDHLGCAPRHYAIVEVSGALKHRQMQTLRNAVPHLFDRVQWWTALPETFEAVVIGNEVLDAMPVKLLHRHESGWMERGVAQEGDDLVFADRATALLPPTPEAHALPMGTVTEIHPQALAFVRTLADRLSRGAALFIDYGFPQREYYHPQRHMGTLQAHYRHRVLDDVLLWPGLADITSHIDFTAIALAAQDAGLDVLGYTSQASFLMNCGLLDLVAAELAAGPPPVAPSSAAALCAATAAPGGSHYLRQTAAVNKLLNESEMGELFKVIALGRGVDAHALRGFARGDRTHTL